MHDEDVYHPNHTLQEKLSYIYELRREGGRVNLYDNANYQALLAAFDNPQDRLPPVIHLAGTNGKGSTLATIRSVLESAGYKVHAYTSPHLEKFNERLYVAGDFVDDDTLNALLDETFEKNAGHAVTFFEFTTAMACALFARVPADVVLLETGMGGRLDCTNIVDMPLLTVITQIAYDHMEFLGDTLDQIASEKAGIMKKGAPCILAPQHMEEQAGQITDVFVQKAEELNVLLYRAGAEWHVQPNNEGMVFDFKGDVRVLPRPNLVGHHQIDNAGTAIAALNVIRSQFTWTDADLDYGLTHIQWPGRLQRIADGELIKKLPPQSELWFDGGHNTAAARILAKQIRHWKAYDTKRVHVFLHMKEGKDVTGTLRLLEDAADSVTLFENGDDFVSKILQKAKNTPSCRLLVCGSLYNWAYCT